MLNITPECVIIKIGVLDLFIWLLMVFGLGTAVTLFRDAGQKKLDADRKWYRLTFPSEMSEKSVQAFIRAIGQNLRGGSPLRGVPSLVFEVRARPTGITHRLGVPAEAAPYLISQLQSALPGIEIAEVSSTSSAENDMFNKCATNVQVDHIDRGGFHYGATLHMANYAEELPIVNTLDFSNRILATLQDTTQRDDEVVIQWVISHSDNQKIPSPDRPAKQQGFMSTLLIGKQTASKDSVTSQRKKQQDQNFTAIGRVGAIGREKGRAKQLVGHVIRAFTSERGSAYLYAKVANPRGISADIATGRTPFTMTAQLNVAELASVIAWPMDSSYISGMERGTTRHLPAAENIPRNGRVLGQSTMPGIDRQIAMSYQSAATHLFISGATGVGKTALMVNTIRQDMESGAGIIVIEREGNLFKQALDQVPPERMEDVICIDLTKTERPLGLNLLRLGKPEIVAGQLATLLDALYPNNKSLYANQLVQQGIPVLASAPRATITDLLPLVHPGNPVEKVWARKVTEGVAFWHDWYKDEKQMQVNSQPLKNRMWELLTPEPIRYLVNQETSSFEPYDVIMGNKILLVNLAGVSEQAASLIGTMIVTAIWSAAKRGRPNKPNFMYLDEFQQFSHLSADFEDMLATARKHNLGLVIATQYIERLKRATQEAVMANARTKVIFQSSSNSAKTHADDFASGHVKKEAFMNLKAHTALARINTEQGISAPITLQTFPEPPGYGLGAQILQASAERYGRNVGQINKDDSTRRVVETKEPTVKRKDIGRSSYDA